MGSLRPQSSLPSLHDAATSASSSRTLDRFAVPMIPRWEELRADGHGRSASPGWPPSHPPAQRLQRPPSRNTERLTPPAPVYRHTPDMSYSMAESPLDFHGRSRAELEALYRQQQMASELERARMRDRVLRSEQMHMDHPSSSRPSSRTSSPRKMPQHKVYLINCKHCDLFLTDRGMKAVLLLKPNITLYSTDSIPTNCSPLYPPSQFLTGNSHHGPPVERTCDCLTQTLGCHGCGAPIGYNIVAPCARCTSSVAKHQRGSNGHRTVLHCSEIRVRERRFVPGEPGVRAAGIPDELWRLLEEDRELEAQRPASMHRCPSNRSESTLYDETQQGIEKAYSPLLDHFAEKQRLLTLRKEALRAQLLSPGKDGRILIRGEPVFWSDLVSGGERAEPFDADIMLDMPLAGR